MKPLAEHPNLEPGRRGLVLESLGDISLATIGLRFMCEDPRSLPGPESVARQLTANLDTIHEAMEIAIRIPDLLRYNVGITCEITDPTEVELTEMAVNAVASNAPGTTDSELLQDPLAHDLAIDTLDQYRAQVEQLEQGQQGGEPPAPHA